MQENKGNTENSVRLKSLISALELQPAAFGKKMGYSKTAIYQILSGVRAISDNFTFRLNAAFPNANPNWLLTGQGNMFLPDDQVFEDSTEVESERAELLDEIERLRKMLEQQTKISGELSELLLLMQKQKDAPGGNIYNVGHKQQ